MKKPHELTLADWQAALTIQFGYRFKIANGYSYLISPVSMPNQTSATEARYQVAYFKPVQLPARAPKGYENIIKEDGRFYKEKSLGTGFISPLQAYQAAHTHWLRNAQYKNWDNTTLELDLLNPVEFLQLSQLQRSVAVRQNLLDNADRAIMLMEGEGASDESLQNMRRHILETLNQRKSALFEIQKILTYKYPELKTVFK